MKTFKSKSFGRAESLTDFVQRYDVKVQTIVFDVIDNEYVLFFWCDHDFKEDF